MRQPPTPRWKLVGLLFLSLVVLTELSVLACSVCYGKADNSMIDGGQNAIVFMLLLTYLLLGGGAFLMIAMRRRVAHPTRGNE